MDLDKLSAKEYAVYLAKKMLSSELSFFEGAARIAPLRHDVEGVDPDVDEDFLAFVLISSETDHLPLSIHRHLWDKGSLENLDSDFRRIEQWAASFAPDACKNIIERFSGGGSSN